MSQPRQFARHLVRSINTRGGFAFGRRADGAVVIEHQAIDGAVAVIPANEWASLVSSLSAEGEGSLSFGMALALHTSGVAYDPEGHEHPTVLREPSLSEVNARLLGGRC